MTQQKDNTKSPGLVGTFIRKRREELKLSQKALGQKFVPAVTTQFISNIERGVTPLPPVHVSTITKALLIDEAELMAVLEKEYALRLSERLGRMPSIESEEDRQDSILSLSVAREDYEFIRALYHAYRVADEQTKRSFSTLCESLLKLPKASEAAHSHENAVSHM